MLIVVVSRTQLKQILLFHCKGRKAESSDYACAPHKIHWGASINDNVNTEPNAGSLPIKDIEVSWELMKR